MAELDFIKDLPDYNPIGRVVPESVPIPKRVAVTTDKKPVKLDFINDLPDLTPDLTRVKKYYSENKDEEEQAVVDLLVSNTFGVSPEKGKVLSANFEEKQDTTPGSIVKEYIYDPLKALAKVAPRAIYQMGASANDITAFTAGALDEAAKGISDITGIEKGTFFEGIENWALSGAKGQRKVLEESDIIGVSEELKGKRLWDNPQLLLDPEWLIQNVGDTAASMVPILMTAWMTGGSTASAAAVGGAMEGSNLYAQMREEGITSRTTALNTSLAFGGVSVWLNKIGLDKILDKTVVKTIKGKIAKAFVSGSVEATTEWLEEPTQALLKAMAEGQPSEEIKKAVIEAATNIDVIPGAFLSGGGMSYVSQKRYVEPKKQEAKLIKQEEILKEKRKTNEMAGQPLNDAFESRKNVWIGEKDVRIHDAKVESSLIKKDLTKNFKKQSKDIDDAIQIYIDLKRNPEHLNQYYNELTKEQQKIVDLSQNLPPEALKIADQIQESYKELGVESLDANVIKNTLENYVSRQWDLTKESVPEKTKERFAGTTKHAEQREFDTIVEGWANKHKLKIGSASENLRTYKEELTKIIEDKKFIDELKRTRDTEGNPLITTRHLEGYVELEHPNMTTWQWAGNIKEDLPENLKEDLPVGAMAENVFGKNFYMTEDGNIMEKRKLYAPKKHAKNLNNILGASALNKIPGVKTITKYNAITKAWILQSSLFHHQAYLRSFYFPGASLKAFKHTPRAAIKAGIKAIETSDPIIRHGVKNGLTLGIKQDWDEGLLQEKTKIGEILDKTKATKKVKDTILKFREIQTNYLFNEMGSGLKAKSYMIEYKEQIKKHPNENVDKVAQRVARMINDDYGGLHLARMGRNPTTQHIFRLLALAPDWTESNVRSFVKMFGNANKDKAERLMYQKFWGGVALKGMALTVMLNFVLAGGDIDDMVEKYEDAWEDDNLNWLKVDVTPIYEVFGGNTGRRKYFSLFGHFQDPVKWLVHPGKSILHKKSVVAGVGWEAAVGTDYAGRSFTTFEDLLSEGETVKWGHKSGTINYDQLPAYILSQLIGAQPVQFQNAVSYTTGEMEGFDALLSSMGIRITSTYE